MNLVQEELDGTIRDALENSALTFESPAHGQFLVRLEGQHKLATMCWLVAGDPALLVEATDMTRRNEIHAQLFRLMLHTNTNT